jgi:hypothetical protein
MSMPDNTAPVGNAGVKQPVAVPQSILYQLSKGAQSILGGL